MTNSLNTSKFLAAMAVAFAVVIPATFAHAADFGYSSDLTGIDYSTPADYGSSGYSSDLTGLSYTTPTDYTSYGGGYSSDLGSVNYTTPASYNYSTPSSYYGGGGYQIPSGFSFSGMGFGGTSGGSTFAPTTVSNNVPTTVYAPTNTNTCTAPNSCNSSVDNHSIFNAPTTVTVTNPAPAQTQTQVVYQPVPVYNQPSYNPTCYSCQAPIVYPTPVRQPYISLSEAPYTGLDLGPVGTVLYWGFLILWCLLAAYLIVYKRIQTKVVSGLNHFLFGTPAIGTHAKVVNPAAHTSHKATVKHSAPAKNEDAIDPFIASQIARIK